MSTAFERRVQKLREHVLGHNKENKEDTKKEEKTIEEMSVDELKELAKEKGIEGCSKMKKEELIDLLTEGE